MAGSCGWYRSGYLLKDAEATVWPLRLGQRGTARFSPTRSSERQRGASLREHGLAPRWRFGVR
ncbi:hypothetical protein DDE18_18405 [Nocardioides gansuensis]|uniref:Uncharacterized protein n=1 Tax=Nocardioides gansuensis TaxID=2138300 RepID=A0A2T8F6W6_9ACTN|nr:hypothetical protein DDE18_18405 [Nocardioides gansuensis]